MRTMNYVIYVLIFFLVEYKRKLSRDYAKDHSYHSLVVHWYFSDLEIIFDVYDLPLT
jgi:hypothetical protein